MGMIAVLGLLGGLVVAAGPVGTISPPSGAGAFAPELVRGRDGLLLVWAERAGDPAGTRVRWSRLGAKGWSAPRTVAEGPKVTASWADFPAIAETQKGLLFARWAEASQGAAYASDVVLARSADGGKTWTRLGIPHRDGVAAEHGFVSLLPVGPDSVRAIWLDGRARASGDHAASTALRSALVDSHIREERVIDVRVCDCCSTSVARSKSGQLIAYRDRHAGELRDISVAVIPGNRAASIHSVHDDGWKMEGCPINGPSIVAEGLDVAVAWYTEAQNRPRVLVAFSRDGGGTFAAPVEVDAPSGPMRPFGRVDVVFGTKGEAIVSWVAADPSAASIRVARVSPKAGVGGSIEVAKISTGRENGSPRFERFGASGVLVWTSSGKPSHLEARRIDLSALPAPGLTKGADSSTTAQGSGVVELADFHVHAGDGHDVARADLAGKPALLNLWATWCEPCRAELPVLNELASAYGSKGLAVIGVSVDDRLTREEVARFAKKAGIRYPVWVDPKQVIAKGVGVSVLPHTLLIDRAGHVVLQRRGALSRDDAELRAAIDRVIAAH